MKRFLTRLSGGTEAASPGAPASPPPASARPDAAVTYAGTTGTTVASPAPAGGAPAGPADAPRRVDVPDLKSLVRDPDELRKGAEVYDRGGLAHLAMPTACSARRPDRVHRPTGSR